MSLNNSRGFPSILLVNFSILQTRGKTKLSKNGKKNMRFFVILSRSTKTRSERAIETIIKLLDCDL